MATLDMSEAILEPQFQTPFSVIRQTEIVGDDGYAVMTTSEIGPMNGVVFSMGGSVLDRQPNFAITPKTIGVCCLFYLYAESAVTPGGTFQPDIVVWNGNHYIVKALEDWSNYGVGFTYATCTLTDNIATPTGTTGMVQ